ncbi:MAG: glycosyltransferase family 2 protein [Armatimonadota bacterium]
MRTEAHPCRVSVVIPCYNYGAYIDDAVDSILNQTYTDYEIIIVNDGSTDSATNDKLESYSKPKTRVISIPNGGLPAARNRGIAASCGEYIVTLDADDLFERTFLEKAVTMLDADSECGVATCWVQWFGASEGIWKPSGGGVKDFLVVNASCASSMFRKRCWEDVGGYDESLVDGMEDRSFWISVTERNWKVVVIEEPLFFYRKTGSSMCDRIEKLELRPQLMKAMVERHTAAYAEHVAHVVFEMELISMRQQALVSSLKFSRDYRLGHAFLQPIRYLMRAAEFVRQKSRG